MSLNGTAKTTARRVGVADEFAGDSALGAASAVVR